MHPSGLEMIEIAQKNGTWNALDDVENQIIPLDLHQQFQKNNIAFENWENFPKSSKRLILEWIMTAKKSETRQKRIDETVSQAEKNIKANHYRQ
jgi:uncharacterized protein YdeI (YjbR/CyaY-like superfamily)